MKKLVAAASLSLLLVAGCNMNNQNANDQVNPTPSRDKQSSSMQASSITLPGNGQWNFGRLPIDIPNWVFTDQPQTPAQTPAPPQTPPNNETNQAASSFEQQVLELVNKERAKAGLNALANDGNLANVAMAKAKDMHDNNYFDHTSPTYGSPFDMMQSFKISFSTAGENIAKGQPTPERVMNDWMNSEGHRANILGKQFTNIGVAYYNGVWVQEFTG